MDSIRLPAAAREAISQRMGSLAAQRGFRTAFVTGASSGLGLAFARMLRAEGLEVWASSRDTARLPAADNFRPVALDLNDAASLRAAIALVKREAGGAPDVLVNNAGAGVFAAFARMPEDDITGQLHLMLAAPMLLARAFWPEILERRGGALVNVTSLAAQFPLPGLAAYSAAKAGLSAFSRALMLEAKDAGVQVVDFQPGDFKTTFNQAVRRPAGGVPAPWEARVWERFEKLLDEGPAPELAARDLRRALARGRSGTFTTGAAFQAKVAPLLQRIGGARATRLFLRRYYNMGA